MGILLLAPQAHFPVLAPFRIALVTAGVAAGAHVMERLVRGRPITVLSREMAIAVCPSNPQKVYALIESDSDQEKGGY